MWQEVAPGYTANLVQHGIVDGGSSAAGATGNATVWFCFEVDLRFEASEIRNVFVLSFGWCRGEMEFTLGFRSWPS